MQLSPRPDGSLPSPHRFWGEHRLLPLEADARDGELPVLTALRSSAPAELRAPHAPHCSTGTLGASPSMGCQRRVAIFVVFFFFLSLSFIFEMLNPPRSPRVSPFLRSSIAPAWGGEGAEGSPVDAQEQGLEINK